MPSTEFTCGNLVDAISALPKNRTYNYVNPATHTVIRIEDVEKPYGPITIRRWNPSKGETEADSSLQTISKEMLFRVLMQSPKECPSTSIEFLVHLIIPALLLKHLFATLHNFTTAIPDGLKIKMV